MILSRKWLLVTALVLSMATAISGTLAYLTSTETATNTFTVGNVNIDLTEPSWNPDEMPTLLPGVEIPKDPQITNEGNTDAWVWMEIAVPTDLMSYIDWDTTEWTMVNPATVSGNNTIVTMKRGDKLEPGDTTVPVFTQILLDSAIKQMPASLGNGTVDIVVSAYAIQDAPFTTIDDAMASYDGETGGSTGFAGGSGTAADPYLINSAAQLMNISNANEFTYYKVADGVKTLDMTGVGRIDLNGSFDGNGVTLNNLTTSLFKTVGKAGEAKEIKISNLTANVNTTDGHALVRNIYNTGTTTFENVTLHGYIEGQYNIGSFYNYGTANAPDFDGANYTVNFENTHSNATLVCTSNNAIGGMLGHGYEGEGNQLTVNMNNSSYTGEMYTNASACYDVMAMCSNYEGYILNVDGVSSKKAVYPHNKLTAENPVKQADGYYVNPVEGAKYYVVSVNSQLTAYDNNGDKIANKAGLTWNLANEKIAAANAKILDSFTSAEIVNDTAHDMSYALEGGVLKIYTGRTDNYKTGTVTLQVNQYDENDKLLAIGNLVVHNFQ